MSNPPFVVGAPAGDARHTYRDAGLDLDGVGARLAASGAGAAAPHGGTFQMLANWVHLADESWEERVAGWLPAHGVDALVVQREVLDPAEYVATWLRDAGEEGSPTYVDRTTTPGWPRSRTPACRASASASCRSGGPARSAG